MKALKMIASIGAAIAAAKAVRAVSNFGVDDMLDYVGLERNRSRIWEKLAFFGAGALAGAGAGLLLAPASGRETRAKLSDGMDKLATRATEALNDIKEQVPEAVGRITGHTSTSHAMPGNQGR